jgi:hypothetical protein
LNSIFFFYPQRLNDESTFFLELDVVAFPGLGGLGRSGGVSIVIFDSSIGIDRSTDFLDGV